MPRMVLGVFSNRINAEDAISTLKDEGYHPRDISIVMKNISERENWVDNTGANIAANTLSGATTGGVLGAIAGLLIATGVIPGLGVLLIGGPLATALGLSGVAAATVSGAVTGILAGGLLGALTSLGGSNEDVRIYEERGKNEGILVIVPARGGKEDHIKSILEDYDASQIRVFEQSEYDIRKLNEDHYHPISHNGNGYYSAGIKGGETKGQTSKRRNKRSAKE